VAICILVLEGEKTAYELWEKLKKNSTPITNFQLIEPSQNKTNAPPLANPTQSIDLPRKVKIKDVKLLNPKISKKDRQKSMSLWLMPFGFLAGLIFSGMTDLKTFSTFGFKQSLEPFIGAILGMISGWIGSFFAAGSVGSSQDDLKGIIQRNEQGFWLLLLETPLEIEVPWHLIKAINPIEIVPLDLI